MAKKNGQSFVIYYKTFIFALRKKRKRPSMDLTIFSRAIVAAVKAGEVIMQIYDDPNADFEVELKADNSPLTIADRRANEVIVSQLIKTPYGIVSEEGAPCLDAGSQGGCWIVDPLDGTKEFIKRNGEFTVNIAYVEDGKPKAGVIYVPAQETLYLTDIEEGTALRFLNLKPSDLRQIVSDDGEPEQYAQRLMDFLRNGSEKLPVTEGPREFSVVASRSHLNAETAEFISELRQEHGEISTVSRGSSLKLCLIAEGKADVYPRFAPTMEWDTAAGHALVKAAGKDVYIVEKGAKNHSGKPLIYGKSDRHNPWFIAE